MAARRCCPYIDPAGHEEPLPARLGRRDLLAVFFVGRRASVVNAHAGAGHEHRVMAIVPPHDVRRLPACALDLDHLTTADRITDVQAMHRDPITDRCLHDDPSSPDILGLCDPFIFFRSK